MGKTSKKKRWISNRLERTTFAFWGEKPQQQLCRKSLKLEYHSIKINTIWWLSSAHWHREQSNKQLGFHSFPVDLRNWYFGQSVRSHRSRQLSEARHGQTMWSLAVVNHSDFHLTLCHDSSERDVLCMLPHKTTGVDDVQWISLYLQDWTGLLHRWNWNL